MKTSLVLLIALVLIWPAPQTKAAPADSPEVQECTTLRQAYWDAARQAGWPLINRYLVDLESMKTAFVRGSDLPSALAVEREIYVMKRLLNVPRVAPAEADGAALSAPALTRLRNAFRDDLWRAVRPAHLRFEAGLTALKTRYVQADQLQAAATVDSELKRTNQSDGLDFQLNPKILDDSVWNCPYEPGDRRLTFHADGTTSVTWGGQKRPYQWLSGDTIRCYPWTEPEKYVIVQFNFFFTSGKIVEALKSKTVGTQLSLLGPGAPAVAASTTPATPPPGSAADPFSGLSWPRTAKGNRVEFHADHTFTEVFNDHQSTGTWQMLNEKEAQVIYKFPGPHRIHHFVIRPDGSAERTEDHQRWSR